MAHRVLGDELQFNSRSQRNGNRHVYYSHGLEEVSRPPWGPAWGVQGKVQTERQDLGHMPLLGSTSGVLWDSVLRPDWSIQTKSGLLVSSLGVLSKGYIRGSCWEVGETVITKAIGKIISGTYICFWLTGLLSRVWAYMKCSVNLRTLQDIWSNIMAVKATITCSSLAKFLTDPHLQI